MCNCTNQQNTNKDDDAPRPNTQEEMHEIIDAFFDGKTIQVRSIYKGGSTEYVDNMYPGDPPTFAFGLCQFRVKPKPPIEKFCVYYGDTYSTWCSTLKAAESIVFSRNRNWRASGGYNEVGAPEGPYRVVVLREVKQ